MSTDGAVRRLLRDALEVYGDDPQAAALLRGYAARLDGPLRVAVAGMVKAGKSTLLNAILGEELAPTDTGECTRVVTWYRYGPVPRVTLHPVDGEPRQLPVRRVDGRLRLDLAGLPAEAVARLVVDWPTASLRELTLIDTPGIASLSTDVSARATAFLTPDDAPSEADAVVYLLRHLHGSDIHFLESFRDAAAGRSGTVNALAVLSRADEVGAGRLDTMVSARDVAARYREDPVLRQLALAVVPVAGLLAQSARTLRQAEFAALRALAGLEREERERLLLSADRFAHAAGTPVDPEVRAALLERFGMFGLRLAMVLIRSGIDDPTELAHDMARRSGLGELQRLLDGQFQARAGQLKARTTLVGLEALLRERPRPGTERLAAEVERVQAGAHEFRELRLLATARTSGLPVPAALAAEAERLVGGAGVGAARRLGLGDDAAPGEVREQALAALRRWRALAANPLTDRATAAVCEVVVRSCEALVAAAGGGGRQRLVLRAPSSEDPAAPRIAGAGREPVTPGTTAPRGTSASPTARG
ncbi:dynamin family protein [Georgenia thermotolerans]|uniref:GTP-binding protein n=1 Tax=Georgenia thermotolerans TaxID=527326 RepID=A0A7J5UJR0_9MICO|nr:dynamin family protein [Georgenia thermotolerans]KAE8762645.1 GTP-binding protein [Georgenia thermotolerans]